MKSYASVILLSSLVFFTACKKTDVQKNAATEESAIMPSSATASNGIQFSGWQTVPFTNTGKSGDNNVFRSVIADSAITPEIVENGMLVLFGKTKGVVNRLPYRIAQGNEITSVYYAIENEEINIQAQSNSNMEKSLQAFEFGYFLLNGAALERLAESGFTQKDLVKMTYQEALSAFSKLDN